MIYIYIFCIGCYAYNVNEFFPGAFSEVAFEFKRRATYSGSSLGAALILGLF